MSFPYNIKVLRQIKGWDQKDMAQALGCTQQAISLWEAGKATTSAKILIKIAEIFKVSVDSLLKERLSLTVNCK